MKQVTLQVRTLLEKVAIPSLVIKGVASSTLMGSGKTMADYSVDVDTLVSPAGLRSYKHSINLIPQFMKQHDESRHAK